jgi:glycosyltransferase involved in cell wall biosynthesis
MINGISAVICCYNSEHRLPKVLEHLDKQLITGNIPWEVLVIDNASTDRTAEVAVESWKRDGVELRVIHESRPGLSHARLAGFNEAAFDVVSFIDDDNWVEERWIQKVYDTMNADPNIGILGGRGDAAFDSEPPSWFEEFQAAYAVGADGKTTGKQERKLLRGAGMNVRKDAWNSLRDQGFDFILSDRKGSSLSSGGDGELCLAFQLAGYDLYYDDDLSFYHFMPEGRLNWPYLERLYRAFGRAQPVENIYITLIHDSGFRLRRGTSALWSLAGSAWRLIRILPSLPGCLFSKREGNRKVLRFIYIRSSFLERCRLLFVFPQYIARIRNARWHQRSC